MGLRQWDMSPDEAVFGTFEHRHRLAKRKLQVQRHPCRSPGESSPMSTAYNAIVKALKRAEQTVLEIEILPSALTSDSDTASPVLQDAECVGIAKKALIRTVPEARRRLFRTTQIVKERFSIDEPALEATLVLLLFDPEYLTAANARKRYLVSRSDALSRSEPDTLRRLIVAELKVIESFCTSPLHRHSKSPTLFSHRRWVVQTFHYLLSHSPYDPALDGAGVLSEWKSMYLREVNMVLRAGERHPKNYVAFNHLRWVLQLRPAPLSNCCTSSSSQIFLFDLTEMMFRWCWSHPNDTSGWSFLEFIIVRGKPSQDVADMLEKTLDLALDFSWTQESVWTFFRTILASDATVTASYKARLLQRIQEKVNGATSSPRGETSMATDIRITHITEVAELQKLQMKRALQWIEYYASPSTMDHSRYG